jgi:hypothetical protein
MEKLAYQVREGMQHPVEIALVGHGKTPVVTHINASGVLVTVKISCRYDHGGNHLGVAQLSALVNGKVLHFFQQIINKAVYCNGKIFHKSKVVVWIITNIRFFDKILLFSTALYYATHVKYTSERFPGLTLPTIMPGHKKYDFMYYISAGPERGWNTRNGLGVFGEVDGGKGSLIEFLQKGKPTHPTMPYYLDPGRDKYDADTKLWTFDYADFPSYHLFSVKSFFTTIIVATNYMKSGRDKVLAVFRWGFLDHGKNPIHRGIFLQGDISPQERGVIRQFYPEYRFYGEK